MPRRGVFQKRRSIGDGARILSFEPKSFRIFSRWTRLEFAIHIEPLPSFIPMQRINSLVDALALCVPQLDPSPLRAQPPAGTGQLDVLHWLADHLQQQGLLVYEEWKEYFGGVPALRPLAGIDLSGYDEGFVLGLLQDIDWSQASVDPSMLQYELPFLEHVNAALKPHGLRLVDLLPFENAYIFCVKDDDLALAQLDRGLQAFGMRINPRGALDDEAVRAHLDGLLAG
jgi:hypothetical protein